MPADSKQPNVLFVLTDQQRFDTVNALGNTIIQTPHLDRLVHEGCSFTHAYTPSPVCVPARCSLHYGQYPANTGCYENRDPMPEDGRSSIADALSQGGFRTHSVGKCHFTPDIHAMRGFQTREFQEHNPGDREVDHYCLFLKEKGFDHLRLYEGLPEELYYVPQMSHLPEACHPTQWVGDRSVAFLEQACSSDDPWFLFGSFIHPHPPFAIPPPWTDLYHWSQMPSPRLPDGFRSLLSYINHWQNCYWNYDQGINPVIARCMRAYYYAAISFIDSQVGRMLAVIEEHDQLDNTVVVFSSDHGEYLADYGSCGKRSMHDVSARVPLLVRYPGVFPEGLECARPASLVDVTPTLLSLTGEQITSHALDGVDLAELARGRLDREMVFSQWDRGRNSISMAVTEQWKYFYCACDNKEFFFDKRLDPQETRNMAGVDSCSQEQEHLKRELIRFVREGDQTDSVAGDDWRAFPPRTVTKEQNGKPVPWWK